ncbi:MAG: DCC1-like thiol-disulfide oxidoreductase family protein [Saprospiraceae bacterium]
MMASELYSISEHHPVLVFDGVCHLCDRSVQFVLKKDNHAKFRFCTLQFANTQLQFETNVDSVVLLDEGKLYIRSTAILRCMHHLGGIYRLISAMLSVIPTGFADFVYRIIAKNRYRWFGKYDSCMVPDVKWKDRFIG